MTHYQLEYAIEHAPAVRIAARSTDCGILENGETITLASKNLVKLQRAKEMISAPALGDIAPFSLPPKKHPDSAPDPKTKVVESI